MIEIPISGTDEVAHFPDGTPDSEITSALQKRYALQKEPTKTQTVQQFDPMGNPTGGTEEVTVAPQLGPMDIARGAGAVAKTAVNAALFNLPDKAVAKFRSMAGDAPDYQTALAQEQAATRATGSSIPGMNTAIGIGGQLLTAPLAAEGFGARAAAAGARLLPRALGYGADAALYGAAQGAGNVSQGSVGDYAKAAGIGGLEGAALGTALPVAGAGIGAAYRNVAPFFTRAVPGTSKVTTGILSQSLTPEGVAGLGGLGPAAMVADATPGTQGLAKGVASGVDRPANDLVAALQARKDLTPQRLATDINANLGPAASPVAVDAQLTAQQRTASPIYQQALSGAGPVDTTNVLAEIGNRLNSAPEGSPMRSALERARNMLMRDTNAGPIPVDHAETLLNARHALDDMIDYGAADFGLRPGASGGQAGPLGRIRNELDQSLKQQVPNLRRADELYADVQRQREALDQGRNLFEGGKNAILPQDLQANLAQASPGVQQTMRQGARASIENAVGTSPYDLTALRRKFGDPLDWNRQKASTVFGAQPTDEMVRAIEREQRFANTADPALTGSRTAPMQAASKAIDEASTAKDFPLYASVPGLIGRGAQLAKRGILNAIAGSQGATAREELAGILRMSPQDAQDILEGILSKKSADAARGRAISGLLSSPTIPRAVLQYSNRQQRQ
jgi:hypothetical protein